MSLSVKDWIGRSECHRDRFRPEPAQFMQATLGRDITLKAGDALPPLWHWLYFLDAKPMPELGRDGHPKKGGFLPPVSLPRRMWAGGRFTFHTEIPLGSEVRKKSTIKNVVEKKGRTGALCFVTVLHEFFLPGETLAVTEEHDIVYREDPKPDARKIAPKLAPKDAAVSERVTPSAVMLFRYSALTFNGHRIHYDVDYARSVEGYDGLVFHGPLTATLLVDLAQRMMQKKPKSFAFRALAPLTNLQPFHIEGRPESDDVQVWARGKDGVLAMEATAAF